MSKSSDAAAAVARKAAATVDRLDAALAENTARPLPAVVVPAADETDAAAAVPEFTIHAPPPSGTIILVGPPQDDWPRAIPRLVGPNMGPQPNRPDHWDAGVIRFSDSDEDEADRFRL